MDDRTGKALFRLVPRLAGLSEAAFKKRYEDEVGELAKEEKIETFSVRVAPYGLSRVTCYVGGLSVLVASTGKWSLFESESRCEERDRLNAWAAFARGGWVSRVPTEEGNYPVRSKDGRLGWHELRRVNGKLLDVSGGFVSAPAVTNWAGDWWDQRVPNFPGAR